MSARKFNGVFIAFVMILTFIMMFKETVVENMPVPLLSFLANLNMRIRTEILSSFYSMDAVDILVYGTMIIGITIMFMIFIIIVSDSN